MVGYYYYINYCFKFLCLFLNSPFQSTNIVALVTDKNNVYPDLAFSCMFFFSVPNNNVKFGI